MRVYKKSLSILAAPLAIAFSHACARTPKTPPNAMDMTWCDTTPTQMKPIGRLSRIPAVVPSSTFGTLTGSVVQRETGDALYGASVRLVPAPGTAGRPRSERYSNESGGFTFDSVTPGRYQVRVRLINEYQDSAAYEAVSGRVDTVRFAMRAYRCYGY